MSLKRQSILVWACLTASYGHADQYQRDICSAMARSDYSIESFHRSNECHAQLDKIYGPDPKREAMRKQIEIENVEAKRLRIENCGSPGVSFLCWADKYALRPEVLNRCSNIILARMRAETRWTSPVEERYPFSVPPHSFKKVKPEINKPWIIGLVGSYLEVKSPVGKWQEMTYVCWVNTDNDQVVSMDNWWGRF